MSAVGTAIIVASVIIAATIFIYFAQKGKWFRKIERDIKGEDHEFIQDDPSLPMQSLWVNGTRYTKSGYRMGTMIPEEKHYEAALIYKDDVGVRNTLKNVNIYKQIWVDPFQAVIRGRIHAYYKGGEAKDQKDETIEEKDDELRRKDRTIAKLYEKLDVLSKSDVAQDAIARAEEGIKDSNKSPGGWGEKTTVKPEDKDNKDSYTESEDDSDMD